MIIAARLFSIIFFATFAVELFFGLFVIYMNPRGKLNRQFFLITIALSLWSLGFAMANSATSLDSCLFWRRFSALGSTPIPALLLHMFLLITGRDFSLKRGHFFLLYFPALIGLYVFSISNSIAPAQFHFMQVDWGWVNRPFYNRWDWFFFFYYVGYILVSIGILWHWGRSSSKQWIYRQANGIIGSLIVISLLGGFTDIFLSYILKSPLPQMAPLFHLIPILHMLFSMGNDGVVRESMENKDELILARENRTKLYFYLSLLFLSGGVISSLSYFLPHMIQDKDSLIPTLYASGILYSTGIFILMFQLIKNERIKKSLIMVALLVSIPATILTFVNFAAVTVWMFPMILIIIFLVFSSQIPLILIAAVSIITQVLVWVYAPREAILVEEFDYVLRIGMFVIAFGIGIVVNRIYVKRLMENIWQAKSQKLISDISLDFMEINFQSMDEKIDHLLWKVGDFFQVDRSYVFLINPEKSTMTYTHEWCNKGIHPEVGTIKDVPLGKFAWWIEELTDHKKIYIEDVEGLSEETANEKEQLLRQNIKSLLVISVEIDDVLVGFIGLDSVTSHKKWTQEHMDLLKILANMLSSGLIKVQAEKAIESMAYYDPLTGLPNRTLFLDKAKQAIAQAKRSGKLVGIIFMDLDNFKVINDTLGHDAGDKVLKKVGQNLSQVLRQADTVARFGGDEFLIMVSNISDLQTIFKIPEKIMTIFEEPLLLDGHEFFTTASLGISVYPADGEDVETLIKNADMAMYRAKANGKNQSAFCTLDMKEKVEKHLALTSDLFRAQERGELKVYYQPQINLTTGEIVGLEALLRWNHPKFGMVSPDVFIPIAEKNGLIHSMGEWVLRMASAQNKKWQAMGLLYARMAVNLSVVQLNDPLIVEKVNYILKETGLHPKYLEFEITESAAVQECTRIVDTLSRLKDLGTSISIDDFGTEYSSLGRLKDLPIDRIKIDMQFIHNIEGNKKDRAITQIIIHLAKSLELEVLAEGVETPGQLEFLNQKMCDYAQGYYYYKPMPPEEMEQILLKNQSIAHNQETPQK